MMKRMNFRHRTLRLYGTVLVALLPLLIPAATFAASEDPTELREARLEGYTSKVMLQEPGSTGLTWLLLVLLGILGLSVLFKDAKRSHLD